MSNSTALTFCGGVGSVTGANFLLETSGKKILIDCGMVQGSRFADEENRRSFLYDPSTIDFLLVTHAHIDHIGRIPRLVAGGFKGKIHSTPETHALVSIMLEDALKLIEDECRQNGTLPLYERRDVSATLALWSDIPYHENRQLVEGVSVYLKDAGHVLGSAMYEISFLDSDFETRKIVFTGDLGNSPTPLLKDTETITDADYLVMESVYGDRNHEDRDSRRKHLKDVIVETANRKGTLVIPTFSLEKTQTLLYEFHELEEQHAIPSLPVFLDSPLAIEITKVYQSMKKDFNSAALSEGPNIFKFPRLKHVVHSEESKAILHVPPPKIVIAGSGMSNGGRVLHHEINYLPGAQNTLLLVGYQAAGTLGRQLQDGVKEVHINGQKVSVRAHIETISGYSSHKDSDHLVEFVETAAKSNPKIKVFAVMGEPKSALFLVQRLREYLGVEARHPELGERVELI
ncbi:MAG: MBL fold metallo-hydrolase [Candidatus Taylorbacteria bacterium]|nr:MBL fold metallo-hydrolase [Candidatus Taylorbacteria bacterium]